jgi:hypothetical protein
MKSLIDLEETVKLTAVLPAIMLTTVSLPFPECSIVMRGLWSTAKCNLDAIPPLAFDAWIKAQAEDALLVAAILGVDRTRWSIEEKWLVINELTLRGIEIPLYTNAEAEAILKSSAAAQATKSVIVSTPQDTQYIVARGLRGAIKYSLEEAPSWAFDAWLCAIAKEELYGGIVEPMTTMFHIDRSCWPLADRQRVIEILSGIGIDLPLYTRAEAERAMIAMEVQYEQ